MNKVTRVRLDDGREFDSFMMVEPPYRALAADVLTALCEAQVPATVALTDEQREAIEFSAINLERSWTAIDRGRATHLRALLATSNGEQNAD